MMGGPTGSTVPGWGTAIEGDVLAVVDVAAGDDNTGAGSVVAGSGMVLVVVGTPGAPEGMEQADKATAHSTLTQPARLWIRRLVTFAP
jgi:hypothetical protein